MTCKFKILRRFLRGEDGTLSVETVIVFPILLWAFAAMFVYWDVFRMVNVNLKATYSVADAISREPEPIDAAYIDGLDTVYTYLVRTGTDSDLRVTVVGREVDADGNESTQLNWSHATGALTKRTVLDDIAGDIPIMAVGDTVIIVETRTEWEPPLNFGLSGRDIYNRVYTRPRFVPQVLFETS